jgi:P-type E1-E2 ATPase
MMPQTARRVLRGLEKEVPIAELTSEQLVLIKPEEFFPADGVITEGSTTVDEHSITGAEKPVEKFPSSRVYAGTKNISGKVIVRTTAVGADTIASKSAAFVQHAPAQKHRSPHHRLLWASLAVLGFALLTFFAWLYIDIVGAIASATAVLIVALPFLFFHRQSNASPLQQLSDEGIFVRDNSVLDRLSRVDTILFDKTGVITTGAMHVMHVVSFKPYTQQQLLNTAAALESHSSHLAARALVQFARMHGASSLQTPEHVKEEKGLGVSGTLNGKLVHVGSAAFLQKKKIKLPKEALEHKAEGETVVYVAADKDVLGYIALSNTVKPDAKAVMQELKEHYRVVLLSGDHPETAASLAQQAGMNEVIADVRADKLDNELNMVRSAGKTVAYVTTLQEARADVLITMGTRAAFSGDVALLHGDLRVLPRLFAASRNTVSVPTRKGALWYHLIALPLMALGYVLVGVAILGFAVAILIGATSVFLRKH